MSNTSIFQEFLMISTILMFCTCIFIFFSSDVGWHRAVINISKSAYRKRECYRLENIPLRFVSFLIFYWAYSIVLIFNTFGNSSSYCFIYIQLGGWAPFHFLSWKLWKTEHDDLLCSIYHVSSTESIYRVSSIKEEIITPLNKETYGE